MEHVVVMQPIDNPYAVLGVPRDASDGEVTRAYRSRAKRAHPDHGGNAEEFNRLRAAYETIVDPAKRRGRHEGSSEEPDPWDDPSWTTSPHTGPSRRNDLTDAEDVIIDVSVDDETDLPPPPPPPPPPEPVHPWPPDLRFPAPPSQTVVVARTNRLAVCAFMLSLFPVIYWQPVALALGVVAKMQIARSGGVQRGGKRATYAIVVSLLAIALRVL